jgi:hypothetical protein
MTEARERSGERCSRLYTGTPVFFPGARILILKADNSRTRFLSPHQSAVASARSREVMQHLKLSTAHKAKVIRSRANDISMGWELSGSTDDREVVIFCVQVQTESSSLGTKLRRICARTWKGDGGLPPAGLGSQISLAIQPPQKHALPLSSASGT